MKYLAIDTETGSLDPKKGSLLTLYAVVLDDNFNAVAELDLKIKNDKYEPYQVTGEALKINGINLAEHHADNRNCTKGLAALQLNDMINKYSEGGNNKLVPLGHNVGFDIGFINEHLVPKDIWNRYVDYHVMDTSIVAGYLKAKGIIPKEVKMNLGSLAKHFGINTDKGLLHSAKWDTVVMVSLYQAMLKK